MEIRKIRGLEGATGLMSQWVLVLALGDPRRTGVASVVDQGSICPSEPFESPDQCPSRGG